MTAPTETGRPALPLLPKVPTQRFIRDGLAYELLRGPLGDWYIFYPVAPFHVDGIPYQPDFGSIGPMISIKVGVIPSGAARMRYNDPPDEDELDLWVWTEQGRIT